MKIDDLVGISAPTAPRSDGAVLGHDGTEVMRAQVFGASDTELTRSAVESDHQVHFDYIKYNII